MVVGAALSTLNIHSGLQLFLGKVSMMINWNPKCKTQNRKKIDNWNPKLRIGIRNVWYKIDNWNPKCKTQYSKKIDNWNPKCKMQKIDIWNAKCSELRIKI